MNRFLLPICILITSLIYIFFNPEQMKWLSILSKLLPMILIFIYGIYQKNTSTKNYKTILLIGLFACALGDALIEFSFVLGLFSFLIGHLFYIGAFSKLRKFSVSSVLFIMLIIIYGIILGYNLTDALTRGDQSQLILPVICYILVISTMGATASMSQNPFVIIGSILFIISDSILAWSRFIGPLYFDSEIIMLTYYGAQFFIIQSLSHQKLPMTIKNKL